MHAPADAACRPLMRRDAHDVGVQRNHLILGHRNNDHGIACRMCGTRGTRRAGNVDGYELRTCPVCDYAFVPSVTHEGMQRLQSARGHQTNEPDRRDNDDLMHMLRAGTHPTIHAQLHVLELGQGNSATARTLRQAGHRVVTVPITPPTPQRVGTSILDARIPPGTFDVAYADHIFDRLPEPAAYLERLLRVTRQGGHIIIDSDMETPDRGHDLTAWAYVKPPERCSYYRHHTFSHYLEGTPHRIVHGDAGRVVIRRG